MILIKNQKIMTMILMLTQKMKPKAQLRLACQSQIKILIKN